MRITRIEIADALVGEPRVDTRRMLENRRRELEIEIQSRVRDVREEGSSNYHSITHLGEPVEADPENDLALRSSR